MAITIKTNRHERKLYMYAELEHATISEYFGDGYLTGDDIWQQRFFNYRGAWYDTHDFERAGDDIRVHGFDGVMGESYFSAVLISYYTRDGYELDDTIIVGYAHW